MRNNIGKSLIIFLFGSLVSIFSFANDGFEDEEFEGVKIGESSKVLVSEQFGLEEWYGDTVYEKACVSNGDNIFEFKFYKEADFKVLLSVRKQVASAEKSSKCTPTTRNNLSFRHAILDVGVDYFKFLEKLEASGFKELMLKNSFLVRKVLNIDHGDVPDIFQELIEEPSKYTYHKSIGYYIELSIDGEKIEAIEKSVSYYDNPI